MRQSDPFDDLIGALNGGAGTDEIAGVRIDHGRRTRTGAPEVIYGRGKHLDQVLAAFERLLHIDGRAIAALIPAERAAIIETALGSKGYECMYDPIGSTLVAFAADRALVASGGRVAILTAGSSDRPAAAQAGTMLIEMGCEVRTYHDMGVAGLHRLVRPLRDALSFDPDALIVAAGMDGVLPGVVAGLVALPIVALPTSTGYGFGGDGIGAMTTMMQACAPGVAVVNIDNGIGAGIMAGLIANRAAAQRSGAS
ncbi:MAG: nickel pincer cofactor biosynthesis protein LarB [Thermomicrobiales bacterium]|nr:nickel pincer cofactor biosynthesis protein LarB [Thermomicrobiales bacterium]MCO5221671.1 nickel pincer cofactor biosynthesis protein LarB [Thermomicrobiales bacterium]